MLYDGGVATFDKVLLRVRATIFHEQRVIDECMSKGRQFDHREADRANATTNYRSKGADEEPRMAFSETT